MKVAVFSDVHGNLPALEAMLRHAGSVDAYVCLGDVVNYGPWSNECVEIVSALKNIVYLRGNHEEYFISGLYPGSNEIARQFFHHTYPTFKMKELIRDLPTEYKLLDYTFSHTIEDRYIYPDSQVFLTGNHVIGHSHHQFSIQQNGFQLINPGSVGQDRKYINRINYIIFDTASNTFNPFSFTYDVDFVIDELQRQNYPSICIDYYQQKERL